VVVTHKQTVLEAQGLQDKVSPVVRVLTVHFMAQAGAAVQVQSAQTEVLPEHKQALEVREPHLLFQAHLLLMRAAAVEAVMLQRAQVEQAAAVREI
jgi:UDP-3-O-[3-hydroxymyristoyl] glucosamine N-acyltransferase